MEYYRKKKEKTKKPLRRRAGDERNGERKIAVRCITAENTGSYFENRN